MTKRFSLKPDTFISENERYYWHCAQDVAYRIGGVMVHEMGSTWLVTDAGMEMLSTPTSSDKMWFETWVVLKERFPEAHRIWIR